MTYEQAKKKLAACEQDHVLADWKTLPTAARKELLAQIDALDIQNLARCRAALTATGGGPAASESSKGVAPKVATLAGLTRARAVAIGEKELRMGRVAALLVAGGQGSRLGFEGPKGAYPIGPATNMPLFHFHATKIREIQETYNTVLPWYIMTSEANHDATVAFFESCDYFNLDRRNIIFFTQGTWPALTPEGKIILDAPGHIFRSPDGHGGVLAALARAGALDDMKTRGIREVFFFQVDNPLVEIADPAFIGYHVLQKSEYSLKLCAKRDPFEKVGMPMRFGKVHRMVEYTEMTKEQCTRRGKDGELYFRYGSPAIHVFSRAFLAREAKRAMPLHLAFKKIPTCVGGKTITPKAPNGYKFEKFIFDILPNARKAAFLAFDAADEFSPLKNATGDDSPETCRAAIVAKNRRILAQYGVRIDEGTPVELLTARRIAGTRIVSIGLSVRID